MTETEIAERIANHDTRIKALEGEQSNLHELVTSVAVMAEQIKSMSENISVLSAEVKRIQEKPVKYWDKIVDVIIGLVVGAVIGFILKGVGLG